jgi:hydrophobic/amphiphilic exporter-1 (mainly G- bacteria), HAE1 family
MADNSNVSAETGSTALFVRRPVLAFVLNVLIVVAGLAALVGVEVRELPDVDRPVITISTDFLGAAAETIDRELTAPLEAAAARVAGVKTISSSSSFARSRITVEFSEDVDLNAAASDMRDAVSRIQNQLPEDADIPRIVKADANADAVMRLAVTSDTMTVQDMTVLIEDEIVDALSAVAGVAEVQLFGERDKIFRVDINQARLASLGMTVADVRNALASVAFDTPAGSLTSNTQDLVVRATASVTTPEAFEALMINDRTRVGDVATVTLGPDIGQSQLRANGRSGIGLGIIRQAQSNTLDISEGVRETAAELQKTLPKGVEIRVTSDDATFINGAIHEVEIALGLSVTIVLAVIFLFLLDWRATLIPGFAMPIALIGTIAAIWLVGFSVNILTLLALCSPRASSSTTPSSCWKTSSGGATWGSGHERRPCSGLAKYSLRWSRPRRRWSPSSCRSPSCPARPARCSANSASCWRSQSYCRPWWRCRSARCSPRACWPAIPSITNARVWPDASATALPGSIAGCSTSA